MSSWRNYLRKQVRVDIVPPYERGRCVKCLSNTSTGTRKRTKCCGSRVLLLMSPRRFRDRGIASHTFTTWRRNGSLSLRGRMVTSRGWMWMRINLPTVRWWLSRGRRYTRRGRMRWPSPRSLHLALRQLRLRVAHTLRGGGGVQSGKTTDEYGLMQKLQNIKCKRFVPHPLQCPLSPSLCLWKLAFDALGQVPLRPQVQAPFEPVSTPPPLHSPPPQR